MNRMNEDPNKYWVNATVKVKVEYNIQSVLIDQNILYLTTSKHIYKYDRKDNELESIYNYAIYQGYNRTVKGLFCSGILYIIQDGGTLSEYIPEKKDFRHRRYGFRFTSIICNEHTFYTVQSGNVKSYIPMGNKGECKSKRLFTLPYNHGYQWRILAEVNGELYLLLQVHHSMKASISSMEKPDKYLYVYRNRRLTPVNIDENGVDFITDPRVDYSLAVDNEDIFIASDKRGAIIVNKNTGKSRELKLMVDNQSVNVTGVQRGNGTYLYFMSGYNLLEMSLKWAYSKYLMIGLMKERNNKGCYIHLLPLDLIKIIVGYIN